MKKIFYFMALALSMLLTTACSIEATDTQPTVERALRDEALVQNVESNELPGATGGLKITYEVKDEYGHTGAYVITVDCYEGDLSYSNGIFTQHAWGTGEDGQKYRITVVSKLGKNGVWDSTYSSVKITKAEYGCK